MEPTPSAANLHLTRRRFTWNALLWSLIYPQRGRRITPTISGMLLIALSGGIGVAAYNSANNILFIALSLMLACLILSVVLSWLNFRGVDWRLDVAPPLRAGHPVVVGLELHNGKAFLPTYGLWFDLVARTIEQGPAAVAESTLTAKGIDVRAALARVEAAEARGQMLLMERLDPQGRLRLDWTFTPSRRGQLQLELAGMGSLFPFGFLRKTFAVEGGEQRIVWPAAVEYRRLPVATERLTSGGERAQRSGNGGDLLALRRYAAGDSHRLIHWKASARSGQLLVRQFAAETMEQFACWMQTDAARWPDAEQFELAVSLCATLCEDLFRAGRLASAALNDEPPSPIRQVRDLERFLDRLALATRSGDKVGPLAAPNTPFEGRPDGGASGPALPSYLRSSRKNLLTFGPDGPRGAAAYIDGEKAAAA